MKILCQTLEAEWHTMWGSRIIVNFNYIYNYKCGCMLTVQLYDKYQRGLTQTVMHVR